MTFQTLEYIIAIAEERSMSRAADRLLISQPTLSRQLNVWRIAWRQSSLCANTMRCA